MSGVPQRIKCDGCGEAACDGDELKSPYEIIATCNDKNVKCSRKLKLTKRLNEHRSRVINRVLAG